jgi:hypothetical protein
LQGQRVPLVLVLLVLLLSVLELVQALALEPVRQAWPRRRALLCHLRTPTHSGLLLEVAVQLAVMRELGLVPV